MMFSLSLYWRHITPWAKFIPSYERRSGPGAIFCLREEGFSCEVGVCAAANGGKVSGYARTVGGFSTQCTPAQQLFQPFFDFLWPPSLSPPTISIGV